MSSKKRAPYHHGDLRDALLEAALAGLDRDGELPSWRALARACGVSKSAPYRHFASLDALTAAVAIECFGRLETAVIAAIQPLLELGDPKRACAEGMRAYVRFGTAHPAWYSVMFGRNLANSDDVRVAGERAFYMLEAAASVFGIEDARAVAYVTWVALHGLVDLRARSGERPANVGDDEAILERLVAMIMGHVESEARTAKS